MEERGEKEAGSVCEQREAVRKIEIKEENKKIH